MRAKAGVPWKVSCLVVPQPGGPHRGMLSRVHAATCPWAPLQSVKLTEECVGKLFLEAKSYCLQEGEHKPEANHREISEEHRLRNWQRTCSPTLHFPENHSMRKAGRTSICPGGRFREFPWSLAQISGAVHCF